MMLALLVMSSSVYSFPWHKVEASDFVGGLYIDKHPPYLHIKYFSYVARMRYLQPYMYLVHVCQ